MKNLISNINDMNHIITLRNILQKHTFFVYKNTFFKDVNFIDIQ